MLLQQQPKLRKLPQVPGRDRRYLEPPPALSQHKTLRGQPVEDFAQRRDADAVILLEAFQPELLPRAEPAEHDVGANAAIAVIADRFLLFRSLDQCHCQSMRETANRQVPCQPIPLKRTFKALKANPVPMAFGELYTALENKTVDGQENP